MRHPEPARRADGVARRPGVVMLVILILCLATREWYPFSIFPMYATFSPQAWYICLSDGHDRLVPTLPTFGMSARPLRRMFETRLLERLAAGEPRAAAESHAAADVLRFVLRERAAQASTVIDPTRLRLHRVTASIVDQHVERSDEVLDEAVLQ
jgi:hypothetical protein